MLKKIKKILFIIIPLAAIVFCVPKILLAQAQVGIISDHKVYLAESESDEGEGEDSRVSPGLPIFEESPDVIATPLNNPADTPQPINNNITSLPWYITRAAGITAYILMFFIVLLGESMTTGLAYNFLNPTKAWTIHKYLGIAFGFTLLMHIASLMFDNFMNFRLADILIPFSSSYRPLFLSLGIFGFYLVMAVILSSLLFRLKLPFLWRNIHYLVYPLFIISTIHGIFLGSDTKTLTIQITYSLSGFIFIILLIHRWYFRASKI